MNVTSREQVLKGERHNTGRGGEEGGGELSNLLNKNHPFRPTITHEVDPAPPQVEDSGSKLSRQAENQPICSAENSSAPSSFSRMKKKAKLILWCVLGGIFVCVYLGIYDYLYPQEHAQAVAQGNHAASVFGDSTDQDVEWESLRGRTVEEARSSAGFLRRIFCRGAKGSSFCFSGR